MTWRIEFDAAAVDAMRRMDKPIRHRILDYLKQRIAPSENPRQWGKPLRGDKRGLWRYRVGDYRILCQLIDDRLTVLVVDVGHRGRVYER
ncbi:MAG: type II toxin-antitoxin system RelE/ParE family toxin [Nitrospirae bacterium]|nr:type II toxin-antitoxin system RelE/ParE family toxin [Magnetococcales bacterium]